MTLGDESASGDAAASSQERRGDVQVDGDQLPTSCAVAPALGEEQTDDGWSLGDGTALGGARQR
jgi:hypothetical protein